MPDQMPPHSIFPGQGNPGERPRRQPPPPYEAPARMNVAAILAAAILVVMAVAAAVVFLPDRDKEQPAPQPDTKVAAQKPQGPSKSVPVSPPQALPDYPSKAADDSPPPAGKDIADEVARILGDGIHPEPPVAAGPPPGKPTLAPEDLLPVNPPPPAVKPPAPEKSTPPKPVEPPKPNPPPETTPKPKVTPPKPTPLPAPEKTVTPSKPPPAPAEKAVADAAFEKRLERSESDLRAELARMPELRLVTDLELKTFREALALSAARKGGSGVSNPAYLANLQVHKALAQRGLKEGLPLRGGAGTRLDPRTALVIQTVSKELRDMGFVSVPGVASRVALSGGRFKNVPGTSIAGGSDKAKTDAFRRWCDDNQVEKVGGALATLLQMLQVEDATTRLVLVREMGKAKSAVSAAVLAGRALTDPSREVRQAAVAALKKRSAAQYQAILMQGFTYPWAPVADHAAEALVALNDKGAVPVLVALLDQPDPTLPLVVNKRTGKRVVRELVRLNHMRNCFLCHVPSADTKDGLIRGAVPTPGKPLPAAYYAATSGDFVRADTTFLRQDFSIVLTVEDAKPWPAEQRYDYVVRQRILPPEKGTDVKKPDAGEPAVKGITTYPQREAALYALRRLTGKDGGDSSKKWRELLFITTKDTPDKKTPPKGKEASPGKAVPLPGPGGKG